MTRTPDADHLLRYLARGRRSARATLDGVGEYDARRPLTPSGTNLLGVVKHLALVELGYFGECLGREVPDRPGLLSEERIEAGEDMWLPADQSREEVLALYDLAAERTEAAVRELGLDVTGTVPWWQDERRHPTVGQLLVHMISETAQHAGHLEILREGLDSRSGDQDRFDAQGWSDYVALVEREALPHRG